MNIIILYFSGTGTTAHLAGELKNRWENRDGLAVRMVPAEEALRRPAILGDAEALVFGYPVYDYGPPDIISDVMNRLPERRTPIPVAQFVTFGISPGFCIRRGAGSFRHKGYHPVAATGFKAPAAVAMLYARADRFPFSRLFRFGRGTPDRLTEFADRAADSFIGFRPEHPAAALPPANPVMAALSAAAPGPAFSRATFGRTFYRNLDISEACTGCGRCVRRCPVSNLSMNGVRAEVVHPNGCLRCLRCVVECPAEAVNFTSRRRTGRLPENGWGGLYEASR